MLQRLPEHNDERPARVDPTASSALPERQTETAALVVNDLWRSFGGVVAVQGCSFDVRPNSITGLVGPNGAGKSTVINLVSGLIKPDKGRIYLDGEEIQGHAMDWVSRAGLIRTFQVAREWPKLTVLENVLAAAPAGHRETVWRALFGRRATRREEALLEGRASELLARLNLTHVVNELAGRLSGGQKRLLEFARVAMVAPKVVLLDEPLAGVNPVLGDELGRAIQGLRDDGATVVVVEHNMGFVERICDTVVVMATGRVIGEGSMSQLRTNQDVVEAYLGRTAAHE
ncbi:MAG: ABC transporter ATP-binding protein [Pseudonocardiales bacterium]|nr:MAG: ABC transporter ATP-binding protein [Pseudonocardiales bacterium]